MKELYGIPVLTGSVPDLSAIDPGALSVVLEKLGPWLADLGKNLLVSLVIFLVGKKLIRMFGRMLDRSLERAGMEEGAARFLKAAVKVCLYGLLLLMIAGQLGINTTSLVAVAGTAGLALSLALEGTLANFAGGALLLITRPFQVGDYITCGEGEGTVSSVGLVYTTLNTVDNKVITVPNGTLSNITVTNVTAMDYRRVDLTIRVSYRADIKKAKEILERIYRGYPPMDLERDVVVYVDSLGENAVVLGARGWVPADAYWKARWDLMEAMKLAFDEAGIEIPFNQLDVHMIQ